MTDTEIVVVENDTSVETAAVILKVFTVIFFKKGKEYSKDLFAEILCAQNLLHISYSFKDVLILFIGRRSLV